MFFIDSITSTLLCKDNYTSDKKVVYMINFINSIKKIPQLKDDILDEVIKIADKSADINFNSIVELIIFNLKIDSFKYLELPLKNNFVIDTIIYNFSDDLKKKICEAPKEVRFKIVCSWLKDKNEYTLVYKYGNGFENLIKNDKELCIRIFKHNVLGIVLIKPEWQTDEILFDAIDRWKHIYTSLYEQIANPSEQVLIKLVEKRPRLLQLIPKEKQTINIVYEALKRDSLGCKEFVKLDFL